jgi:hypothetical protein
VYAATLADKRVNSPPNVLARWCSLRTYILYEVHSQLAENAAEDNKYVEKWTPTLTKFIADSSLAGKRQEESA